MASITLVELIALKAMMKSMKTKATSRCMRLRSFTSSFLPNISTQRLVVMAVKAESALEKLAATMPMVNKTTTRVPIAPEAANIGNRSSGACRQSHCPASEPASSATHPDSGKADWQAQRQNHSCKHPSGPHGATCR